MKRISARLSLALTLLTLGALALSPRPLNAQAANAPAPVPFKATSTLPIAQIAEFVLPVDPPQVVETFAIKTKASPMGDVTFSNFEMGRLDEKGLSRSITDGIGVFVAPNGDAILLSHHSLFRPSATGLTGEGEFTITGGRGAYCGAIGSGHMSLVVDFPKGEVTFNWDGMIQLPPKL